MPAKSSASSVVDDQSSQLSQGQSQSQGKSQGSARGLDSEDDFIQVTNFSDITRTVKAHKKQLERERQALFRLADEDLTPTRWTQMVRK